MAAGEQADEQSFDGPVLSDDDLLDLEQGPFEQGGVGGPRGRRPVVTGRALGACGGISWGN